VVKKTLTKLIELDKWTELWIHD